MLSNLLSNPVLFVLWLLWAVLLLGSLAVAARRPDGRLPILGKVGSTAALTIAAWVGAAAGKPDVAVAILVALGITMGLVGDLALAPLLPLRRPLPAGMAAFALGFVFYCAALLAYSSRSGLTALAPMAGSVAVWLAVGAGGWYLTVRPSGEAAALRGAALVYSLLLATAAGLASGIILQRFSLLPVAIGTALFVSSDLLLAAGELGGAEIPARDLLIWGTYGPAQMLIVFGIVLAAS